MFGRKRSNARAAVVGGCRVVLDLRTREAVVTSHPTTTDADRDAVTRWVVEQLREAGWEVYDPLQVRDSLWK